MNQKRMAATPTSIIPYRDLPSRTMQQIEPPSPSSGPKQRRFTSAKLHFLHCPLILQPIVVYSFEEEEEEGSGQSLQKGG